MVILYLSTAELLATQIIQHTSFELSSTFTDIQLSLDYKQLDDKRGKAEAEVKGERT